MKRAVKFCFMAAVALLIPGLILCAAGTFAGGGWWEALSRNNVFSGSKAIWRWGWEENNRVVWPEDSLAVNDPFYALSGSDEWQVPHQAGEIKKLDFTVQVGHLELTLGDEFSLNTDGCEGILVDSSKEDGVWKLEVWADHNHDFLHGSDGTVEVVLPRDAWYETVELECSAGSITGEELACGSLAVDAQAGSVQLRRVQADSMELNADAGSVDVGGTVSGKVDMEVNAGTVTLRTPRPEQYGYAIECNLGSVELFGNISTAMYKREAVNEELRPFFDLEVNTGKAVVRQDSDL